MYTIPRNNSGMGEVEGKIPVLIGVLLQYAAALGSHDIPIFTNKIEAVKAGYRFPYHPGMIYATGGVFQ